MLHADQHAAGYAVQTAFIGAGAVVGSIFPWFLEVLGVANTAAPGNLPDTVRLSFWCGGAVLLGAVLWTVITTREFSPAEQAAYSGHDEVPSDLPVRALAAKSYGSSAVWAVAGIAVIGVVATLGLEKEVLLLGGLLAIYGALSAIAITLARKGRTSGMLASIVGDFAGMPDVMKRLALVQFFTWSAMFIMWINTTPVVTQYTFGSSDPASAAYNEGANWVNVLFTVYNGVAALAALFLLPIMSRTMGQVRTHAICLTIGAAGFLGFFLLRAPQALLLCEVAIGIAWASTLAMPYAILASNLPQAKLGIYMGLFNVFIVVPQLLVATVMGSLMKAFFPGEPVWTMLFAAGAWIVAAIAMLRVAATIPNH